MRNFDLGFGPLELLAHGFGAVNLRTGKLIILDEGDGRVYGTQEVTLDPAFLVGLAQAGDDPIEWALGHLCAPAACGFPRWQQVADTAIWDLETLSEHIYDPFWADLCEELSEDGWFFC